MTEPTTIDAAPALPCDLQPLGSNILIRVDDNDTTTPGGILLPDVAQREANLGTVIAVGPGKWRDGGERETMQINVGDRVLFRRYNGTELGSEWKDLLLFEQDAVSGVVVGEEEEKE